MTEPLSWVHAGRLRAAARELTSALAQITAIARDGENPGGAGPPYTPLEPSEWDPLAEALSELVEAARRVGELAGAEAGPAAHGRPGTRAAVSARLARIEDALRDLNPERLSARYGALPGTTAAELAALCDQIEEAVRRARALVRRQS